MKITTWNVRGLNDPIKVKEVKHFLHSQKISLCSLFETRVRQQNSGKIQKKFGNRWSWINNYACSPRGRIWVGWLNNDVNINVLSVTEQVITMEVKNSYGLNMFKMAAVYGLHTIADRKVLWEELYNFVSVCHEPCILIGDYNAVYSAQDRLNGNDVSEAETSDLRSFVLKAQLLEAPTTGLFYSWNNKSIGADRISSRIDKSFVNVAWINQYPDVVVEYREAGISDHSPLIFNLATQHDEGGRPFKFLNFLADQNGFVEVVKEAWGSANHRFKMKNIWVRLQAVKRALKSFHSKKFSKAHCQVEELRRKLAAVQALPEVSQVSELQEEEKDLIAQLRKWSTIDESILKQKSRIQWLSLGDSNSKFFFTAIKVRKARNKIVLLQNDRGDQLTENTEIQNEICNFYRRLLGTSSSQLEAIDLHVVRVGAKLSATSCAQLVQPITIQEIDQALADIDDTKAPGLDGFNSVFFKKSWLVIKQEIYEGILDFFENGFMHKPINCTAVTLIPKIDEAKHAKDYRPIACCSTLYKIISKILTKRLQAVITEVVDCAQTGFIPERHIGDNILLATELIRGYNRRHVSPRCVIKVDIRKAYDSVEWVFLESMLKELGFPSMFIRWIMACVKTVSYSILLNGIPSIPFDAQKGLRQGDPLSPFLFALSMEYLSRCMGNMCKDPEFNFHPKCERIKLTHLMFADDLLMFARADASSISKIMAAFNSFSKASGLQASIEKSCIYFGGVCHEEAEQLADRIQMPIGSLPFRYLGVPLASKKLNFSQCKPLIDKITTRAQGWVAHLLSYAGRLQLVKTILYSMQNYWGQIFPLPKKLIKAVETTCRKFLWTGTVDTSYKAPVAWDFLQQPKSTGGLNVTNMVLWNKAAILKLLWAITFKQDKLWVRWVNAYYIKRQNIENVTVSSNTSWILRKIFESRELLTRTGGWEAVSNHMNFSIKKTYKLLQEDYENVVWKRLICNNKATPKSQFILWLAMLNRLATAERVSRWNRDVSPLCKMCGNEIETIQHLFFNCIYSKEIWGKVLLYLNLQPQADAQAKKELAIKKARSTKDRNKLYVMMFTESVYAIWLLRNAKVFRGIEINQNQAVKSIIFRIAVRCNDKQKQMLVK
uniref:Reverse transcriptase domain-containing protein n=1 Tax=Beta vulgaris subsp. vulgaris TaxID=3555 RepID=F4NCG3_BETVV|nr:hypothetical protein [Beta vulgaris subsp. vulgaris]